MAKFVLAGKTDCPYYAKVELLADTLQQSLPNFKTRKISIAPDEWQEWLEATCKKNGWKHEKSPLVWRELVEDGGKGMLLGGFSDFLEHCQDYYNITSQMPTELMLSVSAENLENKMNFNREEQHHLEQAFLEADIIILLDEMWSADNDEENESEVEKKKKVKEISERYQEYGQLINARANKEVKVIVTGDSFANLRCSLLVEKACFIDSCQFVTMATQLENEARAILANKLRVNASDIKDVIVWGNISGSFYIDLQRAKVFNYNGAIKGPSFFSQSVLQIFHDKKWLETDFQDLVRCQHAAVAAKTCRAAVMSTANGILTILKTWNGNCSPDEVFSLGVLCPG
ncbi:putative malate dehydrogenase 1B [Channa argus]|uniref:Putative malate dehydrogenase 1B n=1 Tax=Channa argus TaxID=215402 RepID=A0A6G1QUD0_CHAAH|nr:putative malate dehydrogenase 1B [Channa argus]